MEQIRFASIIGGIGLRPSEKVSPTNEDIVVINHFDFEKFQPYIISFKDYGLKNKEKFNILPQIKVFDLGKSNIIRKMMKLSKLIRQENIVLSFSHDTLNSFLSRFITKILGVKHIYDNDSCNEAKGFLARVLIASNMWMCDIVLCNSNAVYNSFNWLEKKFVNPNKIRIIPPSVPLNLINRIKVEKASVLKEYGVPDTRFIFIHTATMIPVKNQEYLIKIFTEITKINKNVHLILVGDGPERRKLQSLVISEGITEKVTFTGLLSRNDVYRLLKCSDAFIMTSLSEGLSVSLLEALACGLPAVLTKNQSFIETMKDGKAVAFLDYIKSPPENAEMVVNELIQNLARYRQLKDEAIKLAEDYYTKEKMMEEYQKLFVETVSQARPV